MAFFASATKQPEEAYMHPLRSAALAADVQSVVKPVAERPILNATCMCLNRACIKEYEDEASFATPGC
jgi:hypothetical protein